MKDKSLNPSNFPIVATTTSTTSTTTTTTTSTTSKTTTSSIPTTTTTPITTNKTTQVVTPSNTTPLLTTTKIITTTATSTSIPTTTKLPTSSIGTITTQITTTSTSTLAASASSCVNLVEDSVCNYYTSININLCNIGYYNKQILSIVCPKSCNRCGGSSQTTTLSNIITTATLCKNVGADFACDTFASLGNEFN